MTAILLLIVILFLISGLFSGAEMGYLSCNKLKLRYLADEGNRNARILMRFHKQPQRFLTNILIGNNLTNVALTAVSAYFFETYAGIKGGLTITLILAPLVIIFSETVPKDWFRHKADELIYRIAPFLAWVDRVFRVFSDFFLYVSNRMLGQTDASFKRSPFVTRDEFRYVIEESTKKGVLQPHERKMIDTILNLSSVPVEQVMIPLAQSPKVPLTSTLGEVKALARETKSKFFLVYEEIPSLVIGMMYVFDVLFEDNDLLGLSRYLRSPLFISHDMSCEKALFLLQSRRASYGAVMNSDREIIGIVGIENLIRL